RKEGFIVKLNAEGDFVWAEKYGVSSGQNNIRIHSLTADNEGFLYALGDRTSGDITGVLYKINASNGNVVWSKNSLQPTSAPIVLDQTNHLLLTGYFSGTFDFDPDTTSFLLTSAGSNDAFILKLDAEGGFVWASQFG